MAFGPEPAALGSDGFVRCIGLIIASSQGVIIGHYGNTVEGMSRANANIPDLIDEYKDSLVDAQALIYGHVSLYHPDEYTAEDNILQ